MRSLGAASFRGDELARAATGMGACALNGGGVKRTLFNGRLEVRF